MKLIQHLSEPNFFKIIAVFWTALIFYLSLDNSPNVPNISFENKDKIVHFLFYFFFVIFWFKGLQLKSFNFCVLLLFIAVSTGIIIEFLQKYYTVNRSFDAYDILANSFGALTGFLVVLKKIK